MTYIYYEPFSNATELLAKEKDNWDLDNWTFGQILAMSLWFPAFVEALYILLVMYPWIPFGLVGGEG